LSDPRAALRPETRSHHPARDGTGDAKGEVAKKRATAADERATFATQANPSPTNAHPAPTNAERPLRSFIERRRTINGRYAPAVSANKARVIADARALSADER
jgi:hypothetical protein